MMHLLRVGLLLIAGVSLGKEIEECCKRKIVGSDIYNFIKQVGEAKSQFGCKNDCVYSIEGEPDSMFCFRSGGAHQAVCQDFTAQTTSMMGLSATPSPFTSSQQEATEQPPTTQPLATTPPPIETEHTFIVDGNPVVQNNSYQPSTGVLVVEVPKFSSYKPSLFLFHQESNTALIKNNGTCSLATLPSVMNVSNAAEQFGSRKNKEKRKIYSIRSRQYDLDSEQRGQQIPEVEAQCKDLPLIQTTEVSINETEFEKFNSGDVIFIRKEQQDKQARFCLPAGTKCINNEGQQAANSWKWTNPSDFSEVEFNGITASGWCLTCYESIGGACSGEQERCLCNAMNSWQDLADCKIPPEIDVPITDASNAVIGYQKMTYLEETDDSRTVVIRSPEEDGLKETTFISNTLIYPFYGVIKIGSNCFTITRINAYQKPIDVALGILENAEQPPPHTVSDDQEENWYFEIRERWSSTSVQNFQSLCSKAGPQANLQTGGSELLLSKADGDLLKSGQLVFLAPRVFNTDCMYQEILKSVSSAGGYRIKGRSNRRWVQKRFHPVERLLTCYDTILDDNVDCCSKYWSSVYWPPSQVSLDTFDLIKNERADRAAFIVAGGQGSTGALTSVEFLVENDSGGYSSRKLYLSPGGCDEIPVLSESSDSATGGMYNGKQSVCLSSGKCFTLDPDTASWTYEFDWSSSAVDGDLASGIAFYNNIWAWLFLPSVPSPENSKLYPPSHSTNFNLPEGLNLPCVAMISDDEAFVSSSTKKTWRFQFASKTWKELPETPRSRIGAACGLLKTSSGGSFIVLAGGNGETTTDIFDLSTNKWRPGPIIGHAAFGARIIPVENNKKLILVGGLNGLEPVSTIKRIDENMDRWTDVGNLETARYAAAAFSVPLRSLPAICQP